jgi:hypothetical protein
MNRRVGDARCIHQKDKMILMLVTTEVELNLSSDDDFLITGNSQEQIQNSLNAN